MQGDSAKIQTHPRESSFILRGSVQTASVEGNEFPDLQGYRLRAFDDKPLELIVREHALMILLASRRVVPIDVPIQIFEDLTQGLDTAVEIGQLQGIGFRTVRQGQPEVDLLEGVTEHRVTVLADQYIVPIAKSFSEPHGKVKPDVGNLLKNKVEFEKLAGEVPDEIEVNLTKAAARLVELGGDIIHMMFIDRLILGRNVLVEFRQRHMSDTIPFATRRC